MPPTRVPRCGALVVVVARARAPRAAPPSRESARERVRVGCPSSGRARVEGAVCSCSECRAPAPAPSVWPCPRTSSRAPDDGAAPSHLEPCARAPRAVSAAPAPLEPCARRPRAAPAPSEPRPRRERRGGRVLASSVRRPRRASGAVAAPATSVPCARAERAVAGRGRVPASSVRCARVERGALPPRVPRSSSECRVLASRERPWCARDERAVQLSCPSSECRASDERAAVLAHRVPPRCARDEGAAVLSPSVRRPCARAERAAVLVVRVRSSRARVDGAACSRRTSRGPAPATRERPRLRRACRRPDAVVCSCRASGVLVPMEPPWCARVESAAVPVARVRCCGARVERAAVPSTTERYAGAVGAVSEWWTCLRRACRTDR